MSGLDQVDGLHVGEVRFRYGPEERLVEVRVKTVVNRSTETSISGRDTRLSSTPPPVLAPVVLSVQHLTRVRSTVRHEGGETRFKGETGVKGRLRVTPIIVLRRRTPRHV